MALKAIWANKMRSMLTTLVGTAAVIAVVSIVRVQPGHLNGSEPRREHVCRAAVRPPGREATSSGNRAHLGRRTGRDAHLSFVAIATPVVRISWR
jgi:hypothetical protein